MATIKTTIKRRNGTGWDELRPKTEVDQITDFDANVPDNLDDLTNVNAPSPSNGQALVWDSSTSKWIPGTVAVDISGKVSKSGDTMTGTLTASGGINGLTLSNGISGTNFNITGVNELSINDPGEGILFTGGSSGNMLLAIVDDSNDNILRFSGTNAELQVGTNKVWHAGNDDNLTKRYTWQPGIVYWHNGGTDAGFRNILKVDSSTLSTGGILYVDGTTNSVVVNAKFEILVNHYQDIVVKSLSGGYTQVKIKVQSGNNEDFNVLIARDGNDTNTTTITATFIPYDQNATVTTYTNNPAVSYSSIIHTHGTLAFSENITATGGSTGKLFIEGNTVWHAGNDGASSGLDADTLDTYQASQFLRSDADDTMTGNLTISNTLPTITLTDTDHNNDFNISNNNGVFTIGDTTTQTDRLVLNSSGNVGIGDTNPAEALTVSGKIRANDNFQHTGTGGYYLYTDAVGFRGAFYDNGTSTLIFGDGNGSTPIITLESNNATFSNDVTVQGNLNVNGSFTTIDTDTTTTEQWSVTNDGTGPAVIINQKGSQPVIDIQDDGTSVFKIIDGGNVGIGTDSPQVDLHIKGSTAAVRVDRDATSYGGTYQWAEAGTLLWEMKADQDGGNNNSLQLSTASAPTVTFEQSGNVGIGTTSPSYKLDVAGTGRFLSDSSSQRVLYLKQNAAGAGNIIQFQGASNENIWEITGRDTNFYIYNNDLSKRAIYIEDSTNYIGINNNTSPAHALDVYGEIRSYVSSTSAASKLWSRNGNTGQASLELQNSEGHFRTITDNGAYYIYDQTDSANRFYIDTSGNVGIGTSSPSDKLDVLGDFRISRTTTYTSHWKQFISHTGTSNYGSLYLDSNSSTGDFIVRPNGSEKFRIKADGNVGIGTTSPETKLEVQGSTLIGSGIANSRSTYGLTAGFTSNSTFSSNADVGDSNRTLSLVNESTTTNTYSTLSFRNSPTSGTSMADFKYVHRGTNDGDLIYTNNNGGTWTDQFSILSNGNVGIGTTSPAYKLQVSGTTYITNGFSDPSSETGYRLKFYDNGGTTNDAGIGLDGSAGGSETMWFNSLNGFYWNDGTSGKRMTLDTNGNLGIGTTTPGAKLDVAGQVNVQGNILLTGTATTTNQGRMIDFTGFDKEGTTDFTDRAYIQHTTNTGGHTGSVLVISSQNDSSDGIAFSTNASSLLKHNSNNIFTDGYHPNADKWTTARTITLSGDLSGSVSLDGSANVTLSAQVSNNSHEHDYLPLAGGTMTGYLTISSGSPTVRLLDTSGTDGYHLHANNSNFYILQDSTSDGTYDSIPFILTESGNVGIGVTSPSEKLEVNGKVVASNGRLGAIEYNGSDVDKVNFALSGSTLTITTS